MNLTLLRKRNPADGDLVRLRNEVDRMLDRFVSEPWTPLDPRGLRTEVCIPPLDLSETPEEVFIRVEVPGVAPKDIDIMISGTTLTLSGSKEECQEKKDESFFQCERSFGSFKRIIGLPESIDPDKVSADCDNGVVTIRIAKKPGAKPHHIEVKTSGKKVPVSA